jgi:hypothetical protein
MRSVVVVTEDKAGLLSDISYILSKSGVAINGIDLDIIGGKAVLSLTVKDPKKAKGVLERNGFTTIEPDALVIKVSDKIRSFADIIQMLERKKVRIEDCSEISSDGNGSGVFALTVNKRRKASRLLENFMIGASPG